MKKSFVFTVSLSACMFLSSCNNEADLITDQEVVQEIDEPANPDDETFVSSKLAIDVANVFFSGQSGVKSASSQKTVVSLETVRDNQDSFMYVMNFAVYLF